MAVLAYEGLVSFLPSNKVPAMTRCFCQNLFMTSHAALAGLLIGSLAGVIYKPATSIGLLRLTRTSTASYTTQSDIDRTLLS